MDTSTAEEQPGSARNALATPEDVAHLVGMRLPDIVLPTTSDVDGQSPAGLSSAADRLVIYVHPAIGAPERDLLTPVWMTIPGAPGCTAESCRFRDLDDVIRELGATVCGLSTQSSVEQAEASERLALNFPLLSDADHAVCDSLSLPTWSVAGHRLLKRFTLVALGRTIEHAFAPVDEPEAHANEVAAWLRQHPVDRVQSGDVASDTGIRRRRS